jgi:hypothetical protein
VEDHRLFWSFVCTWQHPAKWSPIMFNRFTRSAASAAFAAARSCRAFSSSAQPMRRLAVAAAAITAGAEHPFF